jgi:hypothetical protein
MVETPIASLPCDVMTEPPARVRRAPRDPTVHNAEDDEMRFTGLHPKSAIPSKSFKHLQNTPAEQNHAGDCLVTS